MEFWKNFEVICFSLAEISNCRRIRKKSPRLPTAKADDHGIFLDFSRILIRRINQYLKSVDSQRRTTAAISKWVLRLRSIIVGKFDTYFRLLWSFQVTLQFNSNAECFYWITIGLYRFSFTYTHSIPMRNGVKSWWVCFLYFPDFWMVFVSYFPNFLWSPFLIFFTYFFEKHKFIFITKNLDIFTHLTALLLSDLNAFFFNY